MKPRSFRIPLCFEFPIIMGLTYGLFALPSLWFAITKRTFGPVEFTDGGLAAVILFQVFSGVLALGVLRLNGWRRADLDLDFSFWDVGIAFLLFMGVLFLHNLTFATIHVVAPDSPLLQGLSAGGHLTFPILVLMCIINPLFEEGILLGYVMKVLRPQGFAVACGVSLIFRLCTHLYQGPFAVVSILPVGLLFSIYYWRSRRIWPVVLAHVLLDLVPLSALVGRSST